jgi:hypothetical protein
LHAFIEKQETINTQNAQTMADLKDALAKFTSTLSFQEKCKFPSQPQQNPKGQYNVHEEWKTQIYHFQIQNLYTKEKSKSILQSSPNTPQKFTHRWSSRRQKDIQFGGRKDQTISNNFHEITYSNSDVINNISSR